MPTAQTLRKYGITQEEFDAILDRQGGVCPICLRVPSTSCWCIDHEHKKGWTKLPPEQRKKYIRGVLCWIDNNRLLTKGTTSEKLRRAAQYIEDYENRKDNENDKTGEL